MVILVGCHLRRIVALSCKSQLRKGRLVQQMNAAELCQEDIESEGASLHHHQTTAVKRCKGDNRLRDRRITLSIKEGLSQLDIRKVYESD